MVNRTKLTKSAKADFLRELSQTCNVTLACRAIGVSRTAVYELKEKDEEFAVEWESAVEEAIDLLEGEARRRAYQGTVRDVFYQGERCGFVREYSDGLLQFLLKSHRPHKYRERHEFSGPDGGPIVQEVRRVIVDADPETPKK